MEKDSLQEERLKLDEREGRGKICHYSFQLQPGPSHYRGQ